MSIARLSILALAVIACAWFALGFVQARDTDRATAILSSSARLSAAQRSHTAALLRSAGTLNPDLAVEILRGRLALREGDRARAVELFQRASRKEPMNIEPWVWLTRSATSAKIFAAALAVIGRLAPPVRASS